MAITVLCCNFKIFIKNYTSNNCRKILLCPILKKSYIYSWTIFQDISSCFLSFSILCCVENTNHLRETRISHIKKAPWWMFNIFPSVTLRQRGCILWGVHYSIRKRKNWRRAGKIAHSETYQIGLMSSMSCTFEVSLQCFHVTHCLCRLSFCKRHYKLVVGAIN